MASDVVIIFAMMVFGKNVNRTGKRLRIHSQILYLRELHIKTKLIHSYLGATVLVTVSIRETAIF